MANLQLTKNLYEYRKANALTQKDVSEYLNISRQAYSNYETGKRDPDLGLLVKLSELYEISLNQLIVDSFRSVPRGMSALYRGTQRAQRHNLDPDRRRM